MPPPSAGARGCLLPTLPPPRAATLRGLPIKSQVCGGGRLCSLFFFRTLPALFPFIASPAAARGAGPGAFPPSRYHLICSLPFPFPFFPSAASLRD